MRPPLDGHDPFHPLGMAPANLDRDHTADTMPAHVKAPEPRVADGLEHIVGEGFDRAVLWRRPARSMPAQFHDHDRQAGVTRGHDLGPVLCSHQAARDQNEYWSVTLPDHVRDLG